MNSYDYQTSYHQYYKLADGNLDKVLAMMVERYPLIDEGVLRRIVMQLSGEY